MKKVILGVLTALASCSAAADHFAELNFNYGSYSDSMAEDGYSLDFDSRDLELEAMFYLPSVAATGPILEQGFLSKSSMLFLGNTLSQTEVTYGGALSSLGEEKYHVRGTTAGGYGVINNWIVGGSYIDTNLDETVLGLLGGLYLTDTAAVTVAFSKLKNDCDDCDTDNLTTLQYHQVFNANEMMSYALSASFGSGGGTKVANVDGTLYLTPKAGVQLKVQRITDDDNFSATDIGIAGHYFINDMVGFKCGLTNSESRTGGDGKVTVVDVGVQVNL